MNDEISYQPPEGVSATPPVTPANSPPPTGRCFIPCLLIAVLALALIGWQWMETRTRLDEAQQELARHLADTQAMAGENRAQEKQMQEQFRALQNRLNEMEGRQAESKSQQDVLENLYQNLARDNDESILTEVEQSVILASQQLQLAGNVQSAVLALESANARLADNTQVQFINLRKVLIRDIERLRILPQADIPGMHLRLGNVIEVIDTLPFAATRRPRDDTPSAPPVDLPQDWFSLDYWQMLGMNVWHRLRGMVRIQRIDHTEAVLLPPEQEFFLRENVKLRLLDARLLLLMRDQRLFRDELQHIHAWIERYFNRDDKAVQNSLQTLKQLIAMEISVELPNLNESLSAIKRFRAEKEHS